MAESQTSVGVKHVRRSNFSASEIAVLVDEVAVHHTTLNSSFSSTVTNKLKDSIWEDIANKFNASTATVETMSDYSKMMMNYFGACGVMTNLSLARDLGLVKMLVEAKAPLTSQQMADKLNLRERYVREILGALAVGRIISVDDSSTKFHVPEDNKGTLDAISVFARVIPQMGTRYESIKKCAQPQNHGGMVYNQSDAMFEVMKEIVVVVKKDMVDTDILPAVSLLLPKLESGIKVAEFGCATGYILNQLASRFKNSTFLGSDVASEPLVEAREDATRQGLQNITYDTDNIDTISKRYAESFDWILTRDVIHDLTYPQDALNEIYRCLKPGGIYSMIDVGIEGGITGNIANPSAMFYYSASTFFCIPESYRKPDSAALGATWGAPLAREMVAKAGFTIINESVSRTDPFEVHFVCQK